MECLSVIASLGGSLAVLVSPCLAGPRGFFELFSSGLSFLALALLVGLP